MSVGRRQRPRPSACEPIGQSVQMLWPTSADVTVPAISEWMLMMLAFFWPRRWRRRRPPRQTSRRRCLPSVVLLHMHPRCQDAAVTLSSSSCTADLRRSQRRWPHTQRDLRLSTPPSSSARGPTRASGGETEDRATPRHETPSALLQHARVPWWHLFHLCDNALPATQEARTNPEGRPKSPSPRPSARQLSSSHGPTAAVTPPNASGDHKECLRPARQTVW